MNTLRQLLNLSNQDDIVLQNTKYDIRNIEDKISNILDQSNLLYEDNDVMMIRMNLKNIKINIDVPSAMNHIIQTLSGLSENESKCNDYNSTFVTIKFSPSLRIIYEITENGMINYTNKSNITAVYRDKANKTRILINGEVYRLDENGSLVKCRSNILDQCIPMWTLDKVYYDNELFICKQMYIQNQSHIYNVNTCVSLPRTRISLNHREHNDLFGFLKVVVDKQPDMDIVTDAFCDNESHLVTIYYSTFGVISNEMDKKHVVKSTIDLVKVNKSFVYKERAYYVSQHITINIDSSEIESFIQSVAGNIIETVISDKKRVYVSSNYIVIMSEL